MPLDQQELRFLEDKANQLRHLCVDTVAWAGAGHIGGSMSAMDIMVLLYYKYLHIDPQNPGWEDRDRFVLSKGHAGIGYAPILADKGFIQRELLTEYNHTGSSLGIHLDSLRVPGVDASTGSLGHGLSIALGMALGIRLLKKSCKVYCLLGDGECNEGQVWEAAMAISHFKPCNIITIVDRNGLMIDGATEEVMKLEPFKQKWEAFGFIVKEVDGHNFKQLAEAVEYSISENSVPVVIIADTIKGCGIDFIENDYRWHYGGLDSDKISEAHKSLTAYYEKRIKGE
ncbi:MAG: transketolase [Syntrophomonadaceae bacterium]|jgi:transketolase|nr:transketolase [Syntrophomonadaceae bacterium]